MATRYPEVVTRGNDEDVFSVIEPPDSLADVMTQTVRVSFTLEEFTRMPEGSPRSYLKREQILPRLFGGQNRARQEKAGFSRWGMLTSNPGR